MITNSEIEKYRIRYEKDPGSRAFFPLAEAYRKIEELDEAISLLRAGLEVHSCYWAAWVTLGRAYYQKGIKEEAVKILEDVLKTVPDNILANRLLGEIYLKEGKIQDALVRYETILRFSPEDENIRIVVNQLKNVNQSKEPPLISSSEEPRMKGQELRISDNEEPGTKDEERKPINNPTPQPSFPEIKIEHIEIEDEIFPEVDFSSINVPSMSGDFLDKEVEIISSADLEKSLMPKVNIREDEHLALIIKNDFQQTINEEPKTKNEEEQTVSDTFEFDISRYEALHEEVGDTLKGKDELKLNDLEMPLIEETCLPDFFSTEPISNSTTQLSFTEENPSEGLDTLDTVTLAELYTEQKLYDKSLEIYQKMLKVAPGNSEIKVKLAKVKELKQGEVDAQVRTLHVKEDRDTDILNVLEGWLKNIDDLRHNNNRTMKSEL
ncbi:MAG: tetratricopeptide repeat protein [bacterium]